MSSEGGYQGHSWSDRRSGDTGPKRRPILGLVLCLLGTANLVMWILHIIIRPPASVLDVGAVVLWFVFSAGWLWIWRRSIRQFDASSR